jgi:hypothetical protein
MKHLKWARSSSANTLGLLSVLQSESWRPIIELKTKIPPVLIKEFEYGLNEVVIPLRQDIWKT